MRLICTTTLVALAVMAFGCGGGSEETTPSDATSLGTTPAPEPVGRVIPANPNSPRGLSHIRPADRPTLFQKLEGRCSKGSAGALGLPEGTCVVSRFPIPEPLILIAPTPRSAL